MLLQCSMLLTNQVISSAEYDLVYPCLDHEKRAHYFKIISLRPEMYILFVEIKNINYKHS